MDILGILNDLLLDVSDWMRGYLAQIVLAMITTLLVIYGDNILQIVKQQIGALKMPLRITLFVVFCAFGFSFITSVMSPFLSGWLAQTNAAFLPFIVIAIFYFLGYLAQRKNML